MPTAKSALRILAALWMLSLTPSAVAAQQEYPFPAPVGTVQTAPLKRSGFEVPPFLITDSLIPARRSLVPRSQTAQPRKCRAGRRALIGALIGAGASIPLARLAHDRFENEAASGPKAAATTVLLSAGAGALIGLATCR
jgi:hypothetical protein